MNEENEQQPTAVVAQQIFSGPVPPPRLMAEYKTVDPDLPNRILTMTEEEQKHAHEMELAALTSTVANERRGQIFAFVVSLIIIIGSVYLIDSDKQIAGTILAGSTLISLAYLFITGRRKGP